MSTLANLISDLSDTGPDTPVDPRQPGYALALLVEHASADGNEGYFLSLGERVFAALPRDATDTISEVARMLRAHEWRTESGGVRCRCRALLPTVTEYHDHQAAMLAEAGLLRPAGTDHLAEDLRENTEALMAARAQVERVRSQFVRMTKSGDEKTQRHGNALLRILDGKDAP